MTRKSSKRSSEYHGSSYTLEDGARAFGQKTRCIHDALPPCTVACPLEIPVRSILLKTSKGNVESAAIEYFEKSVLPSSVANLCNGFCEKKCLRGECDESIRVNEIERFLCKVSGNLAGKRTFIPKRKQRIRIDGANFTGLSCGLILLRKGYRIDLFDPDLDVLSACRRSIDLDKESSLDFLYEDYSLLQFFDSFSSKFGVDGIQCENEAYDARVFVVSGISSLEILELDNKIDTVPVVIEEDEYKCFIQNDVLFIRCEPSRNPIEQIALGKALSSIIDQYAKNKILVSPKQKNKETVRFPYTPHKIEYADFIAKDGTFAQAVSEANRCLQCSCDKCMTSCTLMREGRLSPPTYIVEAQQSLKTQRRLHDKLNIRRICGCNQCGLCKTVCPEGVDMGEVYLRSRQIMQSTGEMPEAFYDYWLRDLSENESHAFVGVPPLTEDVDYIFFPGCHLGSSNPDYVLQSYRYLLQQFDHKVAIDLHCCGAPAIWAGQVQTETTIAERFLETWKSLDSPKVITSCSSCRKYISNFSEKIQLISLWEVMDSSSFKMPDKQKACDRSIALFDPCSSRSFPQEQIAVRSLLRKMCDFSELDCHGELAQCCGFGGLIYPGNPAIFNKYCANDRNKVAFPMLHIVPIVMTFSYGLVKIQTHT